MIDTVEAITVDFEENGILVVKQEDKAVLSKGGAWVTILFRFKEWQAQSESYSPDKYAIRRYQKKNGEYKMQSKFVISNKEQGQKIIDTLSEWLKI